MSTAIQAKSLNIEALQGDEISVHLESNVDNAIFEITKQPSHGAFALDPKSGHLQYCSEDDYEGVDSISYIVKSGSEESPPADVVIDVVDVVEISIEVPLNPTAQDVIDALDEFSAELDKLID